MEGAEGDGTFTKPIYENGKFKNPWKTWRETQGFKNLIKLMRSKDSSNIPNQTELDKILPVEKPDFDKLRAPPSDKIQVVWIGHATVLVQLDGITILADPIFSQRCSAVPMVGTKESWMTSMGCKNVVEMTWWDEEKFPDRGDITVACTPSQHFCNRSLTDFNKCLWASWVIKGPRHSFFFGGDTAYCEGWFMQNIHVNPEEAVQIHQDIKSQNSMGIHWGTFKMTSEFYLEPRQRLAEEVAKRGLKADSFYTLTHGRVHEVM
ncbi:hypothetical protein FSP39_013372 [Pinctada imbricata]|uniref:N-acetylphosphatidylethanolamine-hydrolyzing phospholipase D n=1 Tax=Pinctada imbricata TaxID=66713 RepID=A0AA89C4W8_PINIB|nr:hypothetical protein FSP39_013372 [Pinctada imbricata]